MTAAAASTLSLAAAEEAFVRDLIVALPAPEIESMSNDTIIEILEQMNWSTEEVAAILQLRDGESAWIRERKRFHLAVFRLDSHVFYLNFYKDRGSADDWAMGWNSFTKVPPGSAYFQGRPLKSSGMCRSFSKETPQIVSGLAQGTSSGAPSTLRPAPSGHRKDTLARSAGVKAWTIRDAIGARTQSSGERTCRSFLQDKVTRLRDIESGSASDLL